MLTERVCRTLKEDLMWTADCNPPIEFQKDFEAWNHDYNNHFPHQSLNNKTPQHMMSFFLNRKTKKELLKSDIYSLSFTCLKWGLYLSKL